MLRLKITEWLIWNIGATFNKNNNLFTSRLVQNVDFNLLFRIRYLQPAPSIGFLEILKIERMWNCQMFLKFFTNKGLWILKMKIFTSYILLLSSFTFASQGNDGPCEYGCWGGEIDKDCERGCITWCVEQVRDSLTTTLSGYGTTHSPWCWTWSWYVGDRKIMMTILVLTTGLTFLSPLFPVAQK